LSVFGRHSFFLLSFLAVAVAVSAFLAGSGTADAAPGAPNCAAALRGLTGNRTADAAKIKAAYDCLKAQASSTTAVAPPGTATTVATFTIGALGCVTFTSDGQLSSTGGPVGTLTGSFTGTPYLSSTFDAVVDGTPVGFGVTLGPLIFVVTLNDGLRGYAGFIWFCPPV
jgi:hypothetical protein